MVVTRFEEAREEARNADRLVKTVANKNGYYYIHMLFFNLGLIWFPVYSDNRSASPAWCALLGERGHWPRWYVYGLILLSSFLKHAICSCSIYFNGHLTSSSSRCCLHTLGMPHSSGLLARKNALAKEDATVVKRLRAAGVTHHHQLYHHYQWHIYNIIYLIFDNMFHPGHSSWSDQHIRAVHVDGKQQ